MNPILSQHLCTMFGTTAVLAGFTLLSETMRLSLQGLVKPLLLKQDGSGQTYESFACFFAGQGIPEPLLEATYQILTQKKSRFSPLPILPQDSLQEIYGLDCYRDDELADLMVVLRTSYGLDLPYPVPAFLPCQTVADLVYLLAARCDSLYHLPVDPSCSLPAYEPGIGPKIASDRA